MGLCLCLSCGDDDESPVESESDTDIVIEPLPTLLGEYQGNYFYITGYGTGTADTTEYPIVWRFSDQNYWMFNSGGSEALCEPSGDYILADGVEFISREDGCDDVTANPDINPVGVFSLRQPGDSLIMSQIVETTFKEIRLTPAE